MPTGEFKTTTPVVLLLFNRPALTRAVVSALVDVSPMSVYLVADGPRPGSPEDVELCRQVREIVETAPWLGSVKTNFAEENLGLKKRVSSGLDWVFSFEEEAIILEDDCLPDPSFFPFAEELLERYRDDARVGIVSGNNFLWGSQVSRDSYFFTPDTRIWGWATWRRVWTDFSARSLNAEWTEQEVSALAARLGSPTRRRALKRMAKKSACNSWAIPFTLHCLRERFLHVTPRTNLVSNLGFGPLATHTAFQSFTADVPASPLALPLTHPQQVVESVKAGRAESLAHLRRWIVFPVRHPVDFIRRVLWYLVRRFR